MSNPIPKYLISREFTWENVNTSLYSNLDSLLKGKFKKELQYLIKVQSSQCKTLEKLLVSYRIQPYKAPETEIQYFKDTSSALEELIVREKELSIVYSAYGHFLKDNKELHTSIGELALLQKKQVDTLINIKLQLGRLEQKGKVTSITNNDFWIEDGLKCEKLASELTSPACMTFNSNGELYAAEAMPSKETLGDRARIIHITKDGEKKEIISNLQSPITGLSWHHDTLYAISGGFNGKVYQISKKGKASILIDNLRSGGDHPTSNIVFGPDGKMYFGVGTVTNSSVVGEDNFKAGWLKVDPDYRDIPGRDLISLGKNFTSQNYLGNSKTNAVTGAFHSFGRKAIADEIVRSNPLANGVIYRANPDGSGLEFVADGLRSISRLVFSSAGRLYLINNGMKFKGSRPIYNDMDSFYEILIGWYGWPDYGSGLPVTLSHFQYPGLIQYKFVLSYHPPLTAVPLIRFSPGLTAVSFDFCKNDSFAPKNEIFFLLRDNPKAVSKQKTYSESFKIVRINPVTGQQRNVMINKTSGGEGSGPARPAALCFSPHGHELYVLDLGANEARNTGALWKITKTS